MLSKVEFVPVPGKTWDRNILNIPLLAYMLIDNYLVWAKWDKEDIIIYQTWELPNNNFILILHTSTNY